MVGFDPSEAVADDRAHGCCRLAIRLGAAPLDLGVGTAYPDLYR
ncbi:MAG TPA: hypothetical protein VGI28_14520 [Stellaceae bacterium]